MHHYAIGDTVTYSNFGGDRVTGQVIARYDDIKNGRAGFDLNTGVWGYDDQIIEVVPQDRAGA